MPLNWGYGQKLIYKHDVSYNYHLVFLPAVAPEVLCLLWRMANLCIVTILCLTYSLCSLQQEPWRGSDFNGNSLRIGAATSASAAGVPETTSKVLGHWQSMACQQYGRLLVATLAAVAPHLLAPTQYVCAYHPFSPSCSIPCMRALSLCSPCLVVWAVVPVSEFMLP